MERKSNLPNRMPDAINQSASDQFTQIPNELLRNPEISFKAKGILSLLLSNKEGWYSYISAIKKMTKDGEDAIRSGIAELEEAGYLIRIKYRDKKRKVHRGSFWAYTDFPGRFQIGKTLEMLDSRGLEPVPNQEALSGFPDPENPDLEDPDLGNPSLKILKGKNTNSKNTNSVPSGTDGENESESPPPSGKDTPQERAKEYLPQAEALANIIRSTKQVKITQTKLKSWSNEIRKLVESDGIDPSRIDAALAWYSQNVGGEFVPVIESGAALRNKFIRLEDAIRRDGNGKGRKGGGRKPSQGHYTGRRYH